MLSKKKKKSVLAYVLQYRLLHKILLVLCEIIDRHEGKRIFVVVLFLFIFLIVRLA